jgi:hypothetical protein
VRKGHRYPNVALNLERVVVVFVIEGKGKENL